MHSLRLIELFVLILLGAKLLIINIHSVECSFVYQVWDADLAQQADTYSKQCHFAHPSGMNNGQNIYASSDSSKIDIVAATQLWYDEKEFYDFDTQSCQAGKVCGHYTQVA